jgi:4-amino-4-deoxy-L-arabinose transferase-like glycosyltransferase
MMETFDTVAQPKFQMAADAVGLARPPERLTSDGGPVYWVIYAITIAAAFGVWLFTFRSPLWLDETVSMYLIQGGWRGILSREVWPDSPTYSCLLWLWTKAMGTAELTLRLSSLLPMLVAVYLLYRAARALFDRELAFLTAIVFCVHPIIIFAAIDIRPYAFAALAINAAILVLVSMRENQSNWLAALLGLTAACIVQFQLLFAVILPALAICLVALRLHDRKTLWRQLAIALAVFAVAVIPAIPRLEYMAHTSGTHVFSEKPRLVELISTLTHKGLIAILFVAGIAAAFMRRLDLKSRWDRWQLLLCASLALVPILTLYGLSVSTPVHVFVPRYRLVAIPGIALCWALIASRIDSRVLRLLVCILAVVATGYIHWTTPFLRQHQYSWKSALQVVEKNASTDNAPVVMFSDIPEADYMKMPTGDAILNSGILPPLSYYKLSVPVVPLPRTLNQETVSAGSRFLKQEADQRFLAAAFAQSWESLDWLVKQAAVTHQVRELGEFDGVKVMEFVPRSEASPLR